MPNQQTNKCEQPGDTSADSSKGTIGLTGTRDMLSILLGSIWEYDSKLYQLEPNHVWHLENYTHASKGEKRRWSSEQCTCILGSKPSYTEFFNLTIDHQSVALCWIATFQCTRMVGSKPSSFNELSNLKIDHRSVALCWIATFLPLSNVDSVVPEKPE